MSTAALPAPGPDTRRDTGATMHSLRRVRIWLAAGVLVRALLWSACAAMAAPIIIALADMVVPIPLTGRRILLGIAALLAAVAAIVLFARDRRAWRLHAVALWIEEQVPALRFSLMSEVESRGRLLLVEPAAAHAWPSLARGRIGRILAPPLAVLVALAIVLALLPAGARARAATPRAGDSMERAAFGARAMNRLTPLAVQVTAPPYAGGGTDRLDDPSVVRALPGSRITVAGPGNGVGITLRFSRGGAAPLHAAQDGAHWRVDFVAPDSATALELSDGPNSRVVTLEPKVDAAPRVVLRVPAHDSVLAGARRSLSLEASASDDIALAEAHFEIVVSSGEGENFTFRTLTAGGRHFAAASGAITARVPLDSLRLKPGDVLHVRAVARDGNTATGPGVGTSDTRVLRIARPGADDSLAIAPAAPPDTNQSALSERMLIQLTEALDSKRQALDRPALIAEAHSIAVDQQRLRRSVGDLVFARLGGRPGGEDTEPAQGATPPRADSMQSMLARADSATAQSIQALDFEGGESPAVAVNAPLLEAYNAMWDAGGALDQGELDQALPHMRAALAAIERSRQAERVYFSGQVPDLVVDVAKARLQGKERGTSSRRQPRSAADSARETLVDRYERILARGRMRASALADSLLLLRVDALATDSAFAAALGQAAAALRSGNEKQARTALLRATRALAGAPVVRQSLAPWSMVP